MKITSMALAQSVALFLGLTQLGWVELQGGDETGESVLELDQDGVAKLYPDALGLAFGIGKADPNDTPHLSLSNGIRAQRQRDGNVTYWTLPTYAFSYASGGDGRTARLNVQASGFPQRHTWRARPAYLADPLDFGSQEFTAYVRVRGITDPGRAALSFKIRGGDHTDRDPALASCTMMTFASRRGPGVSRFGKELDHPRYDYVNLPLRFDTALTDGRWVGLKVVTFQDPEQKDSVVYQLYVDDEPFRADGTPSNEFQLLSEYVDRAGASTGQYDTLVNWSGAVSTLRVDGVNAIDVAILSVRAIDAF